MQLARLLYNFNVNCFIKYVGMPSLHNDTSDHPCSGGAFPACMPADVNMPVYSKYTVSLREVRVTHSIMRHWMVMPIADSLHAFVSCDTLEVLLNGRGHAHKPRMVRPYFKTY